MAAVPPLSEETRKLVQDTWTQVMADAKRSGDLLYSELFRLDPSIQYLFKGDLHGQKARLIAMFNVAVRGLDNWKQLAPLIEDLGRRHTRYQVRPEHYQTMELALLKMLESRLGNDFSPDIERAWIAAYRGWSEAMKSGAADPRTS